MKQKTAYPAYFLQAIAPWLNKQGELFYQKEATDNYLVQYRSIDFNEFYFTIQSGEVANGEAHVYIDIKPSSDKTIANSTSQVTVYSLDKVFNRWIGVLELYRTVPNPHEPLEKKFDKQQEEEFYSWFELVDEDVNTTTFNFSQQLRIDEALQNSIKLLEEHKTPENEQIINELISEAQNIRDTQDNLPKATVGRKIAKFLTRLKKWSLGACKQAVTDLFKDQIKKIMRGEVDISKITDLLP